MLLQTNLESTTGNWNSLFEMGMLIQKAYRACQWDLLMLGHKLHSKDGIAQPKGEVAVSVEESFSVKSDSWWVLSVKSHLD